MSDRVSGLIVKSQKDLYFVKTKEGLYKCKARGLFRERDIRLIVGDRVIIQILNPDEAYIEELFERNSELVRPRVANIDQIILVQSLKKPKINYNIFDKYLIMLEHLKIPVCILINKNDLLDEDERNDFLSRYRNTGYKIIFTSSISKGGLDDLMENLKGKISAFAGPSGVGKSSILNAIMDAELKTGDISLKTSRGRHTTRHTELFELNGDSFILDTPGFTSLNLDFIDNPLNVKNYFPDFMQYSSDCKFQDCQHINEPVCGVKKAVAKSDISTSRYESYLQIREEIIKNRRY